MHRDPFSHNKPRTVEPSSAAKAARDKWLADNGGEEAIKRRIASGGGPSIGDLDAMARRWQEAMLTKGIDKLRVDLAHERARQLRRLRRNLRLAVSICTVAVITALAVILYYGIFGYR